MKEQDLTSEKWREYDFGNRIYRIESPKTLFYRFGGSTHRIVDNSGIVHRVPAPGYCGCVLRWESEDPKTPVKF